MKVMQPWSMLGTFLGLLFVVTFVLTGCAEVQQPRPTATAWSSPLPRSAKGYELYSWYEEEEDELYFVLTTGTNRLKTYEEIISTENVATEDDWVKLSVKGIRDLKLMLSQLPPGENVFWIGEEWLKQVRADREMMETMRLPGQAVVAEIEHHCRQFDVKLHVVD